MYCEFWAMHLSFGTLLPLFSSLSYSSYILITIWIPGVQRILSLISERLTMRSLSLQIFNILKTIPIILMSCQIDYATRTRKQDTTWSQQEDSQILKKWGTNTLGTCSLYVIIIIFLFIYYMSYNLFFFLKSLKGNKKMQNNTDKNNNK